VKQKKRIESNMDSAHDAYKTLSERECQELGSVILRAYRGGYTIHQACECIEKIGPGAFNTRTGEAYEKFILEKQQMRLATKTIQALKSNVGRFVDTRKLLPIARICRDDIVKWLLRPVWGPRTYNSYLTSIKTFFNWCVSAELMMKSPAASLNKIGKKQMPDLDEPPAVLHLEQCRRLLQAALISDPGLIPYVAVGIFGGLRPMKEAGKLLKEDIEKDILLVRGSSAKDRQRRHVEMHPTLKAWLDLGGDYQPKNLRRRFEALRARAGLIKLVSVPGKERKVIESTGWEQDCLRHTFASHYLPIFGGEKTIAQMGHGDYSMLFTHYRKLITKEEAEKFWAELIPDKIVANLFEPNNMASDGICPL
jgi:integrase